MNVNSTDNTQAAFEQSVAARIPQKSLGQQDFLKLITVQLANQDPMKPMEDTAFIAQMAQFTSLEQTTQLAKEFASLRATNELNSAGGLIGRQVTVLNAEGENVTGLVNAVDNSTDTPRLLINDKLYPYSYVVRVEAAPTPVVPSTETQTPAPTP